MAASRALVDWAGEEDWTPAPARRIDDWTAGEDLDFAVAPRRRRITGEARPADDEPAVEQAAPRRRTLRLVESGDEDRRAVEPVARAGADRRTVAISATAAALPEVPRLRELERRRPSRREVTRAGSRPDLVAMWAVALGFVLILIAAASA